MSSSATTADLEFALSLASLADSIALPRFQAADLQVSTKPDRTYVTDADKAVEEALRAKILADRPNDQFFGEETGAGNSPAHTDPEANSTSTRKWILDPIDGTNNFLRGIFNWATLLALEVDGKPELGVVSMPALNTRWWALKGHGAFKQVGTNPPQRLSVSGVADLADASLSFQSIQQWEEAGKLDALLNLRRAVWRDRAYGDAYSYMALAEGLLDIVGEFDIKSYDVAAVAVVVSEAGGKFTDIEGNETAWSGSAFASNGKLHDRVLEMVR
ncbi:inositol monophosphatase family protein [Canibacter zhoujuaniae]|uniref:inositol monophosphatase family protein n=1 Tax=Canibacter zhoujuaniae TaxID=2708343 RepID=UPI00141F2984|nr:inositol monophosphatase family protein [Canibacter zhoujuaniae]